MLGRYRAQVGMAFEAIAEGLAPYVDKRMAAYLQGDDWILVASTKLGKRPDIAVSLTDPQFQLEVITRFWGPVFAKELAPELRSAVRELLLARNHWAHMSETQPMDLPYAERVHDLARDLLEGVGSPLAAQVDDLLDRSALGRHPDRRRGRGRRRPHRPDDAPRGAGARPGRADPPAGSGP